MTETDDIITVRIFVAATAAQARAEAAGVQQWECPPGAVPLAGDLVKARTDEAPYLVRQRVWAGPHAVALLVVPEQTRPAQVRQFLDLSTGHLPQGLFNDLNGYDGVIADTYAHGKWLMVPDDPTNHAAGYGDPVECDGVPPQVLAIQIYARELGCDWVRLDADGPRNPDLPTWKW